MYFETTRDNRALYEMTTQEQPIKVVVTKMGLDGHDRGVKIVARALRDSGMEVVYLGMRLSNEAIVAATLDEDADVLGLSILSGAHMRLVPKLIDALKLRDMFGQVLLVVGGTIPPADVEPLQQIGVDGVFPVGSFTQEITQFITERVKGIRPLSG